MAANSNTESTAGTASTGEQADTTAAEASKQAEKNYANGGVVASDAPKQSSTVWTEPVRAESEEQDEAFAKAREVFEKDEAARLKNPEKVIEREAVEGVGGQDFYVGAGEEADSKTSKIAKEDEALRLENPNEVVYRKADKSVGGNSFDYGQ